jgi:heterotetrameric sarcosine oxidase gamma subunit
MSAPNPQSVRRLALERCFEFVAPVAPLKTFNGALPIEAGGVVRDSDGRAVLLHFAPRRWLVPGPSNARYQILANLDLAGDGTLVDVDGKWQSFRLEGDGAIRILESSVNVDATLLGRSCAAVVLFDCPTVLARDENGFDCWVMSSYAESFLSAIDRLRRLHASGSAIASTPQPVI